MRFSSLVQRGNLYYFQCRVPADIRQYFPGTQLRKSLKTTNCKQALTLVKTLVAKTERLFFMARTGLLTSKQIESLVQEYMDNILNTDKSQRYDIAETALDVAVLEHKKAFHTKYLLDSREDYEMQTEAGEEVTVSGGENLAAYYRRLISGCHVQARKQDYSEIAPVAEVLLKIENIEKDPVTFGILCDSLLAKEAEAFEVMALRAERGLDNEYDRTHISSPVKVRKKFSGLIGKYIKLHTGDIGARAKQKPEECYGKIRELLGNPYTDEISQDMLVTLFDGLARYPKYRNHDHMKGLTVRSNS